MFTQGKLSSWYQNIRNEKGEQKLPLGSTGVVEKA